MSNSMQGMDTEQGRAVGGKMGGQAQAIHGVFASVMPAVAGLKWNGADAGRFRDDMDTFKGQAGQAADDLHEQGQVLVRHADAQDQASA
jgi:uncharacterized protein YukE